MWLTLACHRPVGWEDYQLRVVGFHKSPGLISAGSSALDAGDAQPKCSTHNPGSRARAQGASARGPGASPTQVMLPPAAVSDHAPRGVGTHMDGMLSTSAFAAPRCRVVGLDALSGRRNAARPPPCWNPHCCCVAFVGLARRDQGRQASKAEACLQRVWMVAAALFSTMLLVAAVRAAPRVKAFAGLRCRGCGHVRGGPHVFPAPGCGHPELLERATASI